MRCGKVTLCWIDRTELTMQFVELPSAPLVDQPFRQRIDMSVASGALPESLTLRRIVLSALGHEIAVVVPVRAVQAV